jgi:hypothetical protein
MRLPKQQWSRVRTEDQKTEASFGSGSVGMHDRSFRKADFAGSECTASCLVEPLKSLLKMFCYLAPMFAQILAFAVIYAQIQIPARFETQTAARFNKESAMQALYGHYGEHPTSANTSVPENNQVDLTGSQFKPGDPLVVRPFWSGTYEDGGSRKAVLLTYAVPFDPNWKPSFPLDKPFSCHACSPLIGVAVFKWSGREWQPEGSRTIVSRGGSWGLPPSPVRLIRIGPHRMAVDIEDDYEGGGITTTNVIIIPLYGSAISNALNIETGEDNSGGCEPHQPADEPACYRYRKDLRMIP